MYGEPLESCSKLIAFIVISTSGFSGRHFEFGSRPTLGNVDSVVCKSGLVENVRVEVEIA